MAGDDLADGGFESGSFSPDWSITVGTPTIRSDAFTPRTGTYGCRIATGSGPYTPGRITQTVSIAVDEISSIVSYWRSNGACRVILTFNTGSYTHNCATNGSWHSETITNAQLDSAGHGGKTITAMDFNANYSGGSTSALDDIVVNYLAVATPSAPTLGSHATNSITVTKPTTPSGEPYQWQVEYDDNSGFSSPSTSAWTAVGTSTIAIGSLSPGDQYWFKVRFRNTGDTSDLSTSITDWTLCSTPSAPTVVANGVGAFDIDHAAHTGVLKWRVMHSDTSGGSYTEATGSPFTVTLGGALDVNISGYGNGTTKYFKLYAQNSDARDSALSTDANDTTWDVPSTPNAPTLGTPATDSMVITKATTPSGDPAPTTWKWKASADPGFGSGIRSASGIAVGTTTDIIGDGSGSNGYLDAGTLYYAEHAFTNTVGDSAWSASDPSLWTLCATPSAPTVTPDAVGGFNIAHAAVTGVLKWRIMHADTSGGAYTEVTGSPFTVTLGAALDQSLTGYGNATTKYFKLYAQNTDGNDSALGTFASDTTWSVPGTAGNVDVVRL